jgi:uncharacterized protein YcfJ
MLRKSVISLLMFLMLAITMPLVTATTADAQTRRYRSRTGRYYYYKKPNFYRRHRKAVNIGGGALGGAIVGGLIGGKKGAGIGTLAGAGTGYLITKKQRPKHHYTRHYVRRVYRNY